MQLRNTLIFIPKGDTETVTVRIYTAGEGGEIAFWDVDTNDVVLSEQIYRQFRNCKTQREQRSFFSQLHKISSTQI